MIDPARAVQSICGEDLARAEWYGLVSRLFVAPLDAASLTRLAAAVPDTDSELGQAFGDLVAAAGSVHPADVQIEFDTLFLGVGRSELMPYASFHLAGFLHERPLVDLRQWLAAAGLVRSEQASLTEDHLACLADTMRLLILSDEPSLASLDTQRELFSRFIGPWAERFGEALDAAAGAHFYRPAGRLLRVFTAIERQAFDFAS